MSRSGYSEDGDYDNPATLLWPSVVERSIKGKRGQAFLTELARELDAMPEKRLIAEELVTKEGECCTMGVVFKARGVDVSKVNYDCSHSVAKAIGISPAMVGEIAYQNDDDFGYEAEVKPESGGTLPETPEERWLRMRKWVDGKLKTEHVQ